MDGAERAKSASHAATQDGYAAGVQGDLEKELTCSICTDLLYQPLTLLDCLHTFCGACLKEWFAFQATTATSLHPYTCPSCRASVRTTQPNATVTTLLDIFVRANPSRGKSADEKKADRDKYRPGDNVLPKLRRRDERDQQDQRLLAEAQQLSLQDVGLSDRPRNSNNRRRHQELPREANRRESSRGGSRGRRQESHASRDQPRSISRHSLDTSPTRAAVPPRSIEHQSSLRSLLSASEVDASDMDEDLVHQVLEELMSEGMDLNQIGAAEEEEITERIAEAVRRRQTERHAERQRERRERRERRAREGLVATSTSLAQIMRSPVQRDEDNASIQAYDRIEDETLTPHTVPRPPISRPGLIDAANRGGRIYHTRSSSQGRSRSARRAERPFALPSFSAARSVNQSDRPRTSDAVAAPQRRQSDNQQSGRLETRQQFRNENQTSTFSFPNSPGATPFDIPTTHSPTSSLAILGDPSLPQTLPTPATNSFQSPSLALTTESATINPASGSGNGSSPLAPTSSYPQPTYCTPAVAPTLFTEPLLSCKHCNKENIEYELHYNCARCEAGTYDVCMRCYRQGKRCKNWFGFGWTAWRRYEQLAPEGGYSPNHEKPHVLVGNRYQRPSTSLMESPVSPHVFRSEENPHTRLESGVFCDVCQAFANACYWKCNYCNDGDWGYCNDCVNQGRHCTHPLVPVARKRREQTSSSTGSTPSGLTTPYQETVLVRPNPEPNSTTLSSTPKSASLIQGPSYFAIADSVFRPLTFTTLCNVCRHPIPPSNTRYHCLQCNAGDYDMCMNCYHKLVLSNRISKEDGANGWRKCLRGHRMVIVGFEDRDGGQQRVVVRDLVGGHALKEEEMETRLRRYPPDGGVGLRLLARWGYWPDTGDEDELAFPRGAEVREAADVNGDWYWGVYNGAKGLFPAAYVTSV